MAPTDLLASSSHRATAGYDSSHPYFEALRTRGKDLKKLTGQARVGPIEISLGTEI